MMERTEKNNHELAPATRRVLRATHSATAEIACVSGVNKGHISRMIRGLRPPSRDFLEASGPALLNLSIRFQNAAIEHEADEHE